MNTPLRFRFGIRRLMLVIAVCGVLLALLPYVWSIVTFDFVDDDYVQWGAGDLIVDYLSDHDGRWPTSWDDLAPYFAAGGGRFHGYPISEYRARIAIDWSANVAELEADAKLTTSPTFRVITPRNRAASTWSGHEPNEILHRYLKARPAR